MNSPFTKENVLKLITDDFESRTKCIKFFEPKYEGDIAPVIAEKIWTLLNIKHSTVAYTLLRHLQITHISLDCMEKLDIFASALYRGFNYAVEYDPDTSYNFIHLSSFKIVWGEWDYSPAIIEYDEVLNFLEWFVTYASGKFVYTVSPTGQEVCNLGLTNYLAVIKDNWHEYPKQIKKAYDAYILKSKGAK